MRIFSGCYLCRSKESLSITRREGWLTLISKKTIWNFLEAKIKVPHKPESGGISKKQSVKFKIVSKNSIIPEIEALE